MAKFTVATELTVIDRVTRQLRRIGAAFKLLGGSARRLNRGFGGVGKSVSGVLAPLGVVTGGGIAAGLTKLIGGTSRYGDTLAKTADRLGFTVEGLQEFRYAAERTGAGTETFDMAMQRLTRRMADAAAGRNKDLVSLFDHLGVPLTDVEGNARAAADVLPELADAFARSGNESEKVRAAFALFDSEGVKLINMLNEGREGLEKYAAEKRRLGIMTEEEARLAEQHQDRISNLNHAFQGWSFTISKHLLPPLGKFIDKLTAFLVGNQAEAADKLGKAFARLADTFSDVDFAKVADGLVTVIDGFVGLSNLLGGVGNVLIALLAIMGAPIVKAILDIAFGFASMAVTMIGWAKKMALALAPFALKIVAVIAVVALLASIAALVVYNWENLGKALSNVWEGVKQTFFSSIADILRKIKSMASGISGLLDFAGIEIPGLKALDDAIADFDRSAQLAKSAQLEIDWKNPAEVLKEVGKDLSGVMDGVKAKIGLTPGGPPTAPKDVAVNVTAARQPPDGDADVDAGSAPASPDEAGLMERFRELLKSSRSAPVETLDQIAARPALETAPAAKARVEVVFSGAPPGTRARIAAREPGVDVITELDVGPGLAGVTP